MRTRWGVWTRWGIWALLLVALVAFQLSISWAESGEEAVKDGTEVGNGDSPLDAESADGEDAAFSSTAKERKLREHAEKFEFQAEVNRLMDIIINSLYSNKDIFLRELISNSADALSKIRFLSLTDKSVLGEGETSNLDIRISLDKDNNILKIRDRGIGMTRQDLINNLGTIAKSGTSAFLERIQKAGDLSLIGQFGVGFYSVFLVADYVEVITKHNDDKQYIWESKADGSFAISEDKDGEPLGRGTQINVHLKEDTQEYADEAKLKQLVKRYSEFIDFPIYMYASKEVDVEEEEEEDDSAAEDVEDNEEEEEEEEDVADAEDEEEDDEDKSPKKKEKKTVWDWQLLNESKPIWLRVTSEVTEDEYQQFFKALNKGGYGETLGWSHFKAEGDVEFRALLYIPDRAPFDFYDRYYEKEAKGVRLYVRRVFISDEFDDLLPRYLTFLIGVVDSDTLPLNVSREMLQQLSALKTIKKKLVRKVLDMLKKLADEEKRENEEEENEEDESAEEDKKVKKEPKNKYSKFWKEFGRAIKFGLIEDNTNRNRLAKLLRFYTSKSPDKLTSLEEYVDRMADEQKNIYYLAGQSIEEIKASPFLETLHNKGLEVVYFTEPVDEYMMQHLMDFDDKKFMDASKEGLKFDDKDDKEKKRTKKEFKNLTHWWKEVIGPQGVDSVKVSNRLTTTPCVVVASKYGWSANMERIMKAQSFSDQQRQMYMRGQKSLEINPRHPLIRELKQKVEEDKESSETKELAVLLFETALLESGFVPEDTKGFAKRMQVLMKGALGMTKDLDEMEEVSDEEDAEEDEEDEEDQEDGMPSGFEEVVDMVDKDGDIPSTNLHDDTEL